MYTNHIAAVLLLALLLSSTAPACAQKSSSASTRCPLSPHKALNNAPQEAARLKTDCAGPFDARFCTRCTCALQRIYRAPANAPAINSAACTNVVMGVPVAAWGKRLMNFESMEAVANCQGLESMDCQAWNARQRPVVQQQTRKAGTTATEAGKWGPDAQAATDCPFTSADVTPADLAAVKSGCDERKQGANFCKACFCAMAKAPIDVLAKRAKGVKETSTLSLCMQEVSLAIAETAFNGASQASYSGPKCEAVRTMEPQKAAAMCGLKPQPATAVFGHRHLLRVLEETPQ